jgi:Domain of unknown function (DUF1835)
MLHIHNGDSSANVLKESGMAGEHIAFREALMAGPAPGGLPQEEWLKRRAHFLAGDYDVDEQECFKQLVREHEALERFRDHTEAVLWFEHDLFCQINLVYLLNWFRNQNRVATRLSLVCIGEFAGVEDFRGLGQLSPQQMASLFDVRREVSEAELNVAAEAWEAYSSPNPEAIESFVGAGTSALPFLQSAMLNHLARFPSTGNGLGHVENRALQLIAGGHTHFKSLFSQFGKTDSAYGLGDAQFWNDLKRLGRAEEPLIVIKGLAGNRYHEASFELTETGQDVLAGKRDFIVLNGIDRWLGGVHLTETNLWRWDERERRLIRK